MSGIVVVIVLIRLVMAIAGVKPKQRAAGGILPNRYPPTKSPGFSALLRALMLGCAGVVNLALSPKFSPVGLALVLLAWPALWISALVEPLGFGPWAYWATRLTEPLAGRGEAILSELRARGHRASRPDEIRLRKLAQLLFVERKTARVRGSSLAARGLLDALTGDLDSARQLLGAVQDLGWRQARWTARITCQAWLLAEAAQRGAFHEVLRLSAHGPRTFRRFFMKGIALRLLRHPSAPGNALLRLLWCLAPGRRHTHVLLRAALARAVRPPADVAGSGLPDARAAAQSLARLPRGMVRRSEIRSVAALWQQAADEGQLEEAITALGIESATFSRERVAAEITKNMTELLAELWRVSPADPGDDERGPAILLSARDRLQASLLEQIEDLARAWCETRSAEDPEAVVRCDLEAQWRAWAKLKELFEELFVLLPHRKAMALNTLARIHNHAVWLYNKADARLLGNVVFEWILAHTPRDHHDRDLRKKNALVSADA